MITIISGTNRINSQSRKVAKEIFKLLDGKSKDECKFFSLEDLPPDIINVGMYEEKGQNESLTAIQDDCFIPADKFVFVVPEYNGSFPGIFKLFIDALSIRKYAENFQDKKVLLVGVASGRAGNLRGLDHLTTSLNYLKMNIFPNRFPIPAIDKKLNDNGILIDEDLKAELDSLTDSFIKF